MDTQKFLNDIRSDDADVRFGAWRAAGETAPSVIPELGRLAASADPGVGKAAREALTTMTHAVGKSTAAQNRPAVVKGLLALNTPAYATPVRVLALRLLSNIAGEDSVAAIARDLGNAELREEAVYCLERIPGDASIRAMMDAYNGASDEFKPRILAALGHRRAGQAVALCTAAMRSGNPAIAIAGAKAIARIGATAATAPEFPADAGLTEWQKADRMDSELRWADAQVKAGNSAAAMPVYKAALERPEEHWQCAAILGIAKTGTAAAAALILPKTRSEQRSVRITAQKAWKSMV